MAATLRTVGILHSPVTSLTALVALDEVKISVESELDQSTDSSGNVLADDDVFFHEKHTLTFSGTQKTGYTRPVIGASLTVDTTAYKVRSLEETEAKDKKPQFSGTAVYDKPSS